MSSRSKETLVNAPEPQTMPADRPKRLTGGRPITPAPFLARSDCSRNTSEITLLLPHNIILVGVVFDLLNRICRLKKQSEDTFCVRDRYTKSAKATSFIQCKQIIKTVVFNEQLTNIERLNHVARFQETGIRPIFMASRTDNRF